MHTLFRTLSKGWNAEPNAPCPILRVDGTLLTLTFDLNPHQHEFFKEGDWAELAFSFCSRYRLGATNDEGWYRGQCRFSKLAPSWGEFYELTGNLLLDAENLRWEVLSSTPQADPKHFLFYFRDETFECDAADWNLTFHAAPRTGR